METMCLQQKILDAKTKLNLKKTAQADASRKYEARVVKFRALKTDAQSDLRTAASVPLSA